MASCVLDLTMRTKVQEKEGESREQETAVSVRSAASAQLMLVIGAAGLTGVDDVHDGDLVRGLRVMVHLDDVGGGGVVAL